MDTNREAETGQLYCSCPEIENYVVYQRLGNVGDLPLPRTRPNKSPESLVQR